MPLQVSDTRLFFLILWAKLVFVCSISKKNATTKTHF